MRHFRKIHFEMICSYKIFQFSIQIWFAFQSQIANRSCVHIEAQCIVRAIKNWNVRWTASGRWVRARYVPLRRVFRIFSRGKASSQAKRGMRPVIPRISPAREPRNGTRSPPSRVTAMKSFVIAPLTSRPPTFEALPSSYPKALSIGSSAGFLFCWKTRRKLSLLKITLI